MKKKKRDDWKSCRRPITGADVFGIKVDLDSDAVLKIRARIRALDEIHESYLTYLCKRIEERDWHGGWDACVNLSETEQEQHGLRQALEALGEKP